MYSVNLKKHTEQNESNLRDLSASGGFDVHLLISPLLYPLSGPP